MSCLGPNYNPKPPREWYRFENVCAYNNTNINNLGLVNLNGKTYPLSNLKKGNVLEYKKNSSNITKNQRYAQIAKGMWTNRTTNFATQTVTYTNPNIRQLKRVGYDNIKINNRSVLPYQPTFLPITCPTQTNTNAISLNNLTNVIIPDGGNLICNVSENICTGQVYSETDVQTCFPTTDSDVPGSPTYLCYNSNVPTYYPRQRITFLAGGNKWPQGSKFIFPA